MKQYINLLLVAIIIVLPGCSKQPPVQTVVPETVLENNDVPVFADHPDKDGYYSIDQPRSALDVNVLSDLNNRLYFVSVSMVEEKIRGFNGAPGQLIWPTVAMEISFNYGSNYPFTERQDCKGTSVSKADLDKFVKSCFFVDGEIDRTGYPKSFKTEGDLVDIEYSELTSSAPGFMMSRYRQDGDSWFIKGEIIGEANTIYATGEFHLESTGDGGQVSHKIKSFIAE